MKPLLCLLLALAFALSIAVRAWMRRRGQQQPPLRQGGNRFVVVGDRARIDRTSN